jgi:phospholipid transport system transporter-binding protein
MQGEGHFALQGPVVFGTASELLKAGNGLFARTHSATLDLSQVTRVDSAALALLIEWLRQAERGGRVLRFSGMPDKLRAIARLTGADEILEPHSGPGSTALHPT